MTRALAAIAAALSASLIATVLPTGASAASRDYPSSSADFRNPERGFWRFVAEDFASVTKGELADVRASGMTMAYAVVRLDDHRAKPLPDALLAKLDAAFEKTRANGLKVMLRFAYNYPDNEHQYRNAKDAPLDIVLKHIEQLKPTLARNADVIAVLQAGFIGAWGEGHTSSNGLTKPKNKAAIRDALLNALPKERMLQWRYPQDVIDWSPKPPRAGRLARIGLHNDCFMSSRTDVGTYSGDEAVRERQRAYAAALSRATLYSGETCDVGSGSERMSCDAIREEGPLFHLTSLHRDYNRKFIESWKREGCYDKVSRSMGYRLVLRSAEAPDEATSGGAASVTVRIENAGWARLYNPRPLLLVAKLRGADATYIIKAAGDIRDVEPESEGPTAFDFAWDVPAGAPEGAYDLALALPDNARSLADDPRYAVRFANGSGAGAGWDGDTGRFNLGLSINVTAK